MPKIPASSLNALDAFSLDGKMYITLVAIPSYNIWIGLGIPCAEVLPLAPALLVDDMKPIPPSILGFLGQCAAGAAFASAEEAINSINFRELLGDNYESAVEDGVIPPKIPQTVLLPTEPLAIQKRLSRDVVKAPLAIKKIQDQNLRVLSRIPTPPSVSDEGAPLDPPRKTTPSRFEFEIVEEDGIDEDVPEFELEIVT